MRRARADFALAPAPAQAADLRVEPLLRERFHLVCPAGHALAARRSVTPQALAGHPFIHLSRTSSVRQHLDAALHPERLEGVMEVEQLATVAGVAAGLGITAVPTLALFQFRREGLVVRPLQIPGLSRDICLIRLKERGDTAAAAALIEDLRAHYGDGRAGAGTGPGPRLKPRQPR